MICVPHWGGTAESAIRMTRTSNFEFLASEYPLLFTLGKSAEYHLYEDPAAALTKLRTWGEKLTFHLFDEHYLEPEEESSFSKRLRILRNEDILPYDLKDYLYLAKNKGNDAVHEHRGSTEDAKRVLRGCFQIAKWFYATYSQENRDIASLRYSDPPRRNFQEQLDQWEQKFQALEKEYEALKARREAKELSPEKEQEIQRRSHAARKNIELNEAQTRERIDLALREAGWEVHTQDLNFKTHGSLPERGKNRAIAEWPVGNRWADYALFIGTQIYGIVEAKRYALDVSSDLQQAKAYAKLVEEKHEAQLLGDWRGFKVPFVFATNGRSYLEQLRSKSGIWFWDTRKSNNRSQALQGWYSPTGLRERFKQDIDAANQALEENPTDFLTDKHGLALRDYQIKAVEAVERKIREEPEERRALLAMATGTGKTRTVLGICYRLIQSNRFRRILFMVDRRLLAEQAFDDFQDNKIIQGNPFSAIYQVDGLKEKIPDADTRLHFATVQGMVKRIFYPEEGKAVPLVDSYDCIIVDEAHRGYLLDREMDEEEIRFKNQEDYVSKYRRVLDYFDAFAIGLTATPALHTREIFGEAVFTYSYHEAVIDGWLIDHEPPYIIRTHLSEEGILWEEGESPTAYDPETNQLVELEALPDELKIEIQGFNRKVLTEKFNRTVIEELVKHLDPEGEEKTLIFAARDSHADDIVIYLKDAFEDLGLDLPEAAIEKITGSVDKPIDQVRRFKNEKYPNIVVTVDLLTTGVNVPSICNLVFMRRVRSRILYSQILGRATRRCDEIDKEYFRIFDAVRLYEALEDYTDMKPVSVNPKASFAQLAEELKQIEGEERFQQQIDQLLAKFQQKKRYIGDRNDPTFRYLTDDRDPEAFVELLKAGSPREIAQQLQNFHSLWPFLDKLKPLNQAILVSEHEDRLLRVERGYGQGQKPEDYLESFEQFIRENQNKIQALQIICTRPKELDRQSLRELKIELDQQGFTTQALQAAWKQVRNQDIAADIIGYIRTLAIGTSLLSHEERIKKAMDKIRANKEWNATQRKWPKDSPGPDGQVRPTNHLAFAHRYFLCGRGQNQCALFYPRQDRNRQYPARLVLRPADQYAQFWQAYALYPSGLCRFCEGLYRWDKA